MGNDVASLVRRVISVESYLVQFKRKSVKVPVPEGGLQIIDVLAVDGATSEDPSTPPVYAFAGVTTYKEGNLTKTGIQGGTVYAANKAWVLKPLELNPKASGSWIIYIEISVTANVADGVLLPGLKSSKEPSWKQTSGTVPNKVIPTAPSGNGTAIVTIGRLTIDRGSIILAAEGMGSIDIIHKKGTLNHARL